MPTLSRIFSALVRATFTPAELSEINRRNLTPAYAGACATHDFCDSNALMYGAFCALKFREPDPGSESDTEAMNRAWDESRLAGFAN